MNRSKPLPPCTCTHCARCGGVGHLVLVYNSGLLKGSRWNFCDHDCLVMWMAERGAAVSWDEAHRLADEAFDRWRRAA